MKIVIRSKTGPRRLTLHFPLCFIKTRIAAKAILEGDNDDKHASKEEIIALQKKIKATYKSLRKFVKVKGHFNLVEIESSDGGRILIRA